MLNSTALPSFMLSGYKAMLSSHIFYPSNCELQKIESKGSLKETIQKEHIVNAKEIHSILHTAGKPLRFATRLAGILNISAILAPLGAVYHGVNLSVNLASYTIKLGQPTQRQQETWEKVKHHARAFFIDLMFSIAFWGCVASINSIVRTRVATETTVNFVFIISILDALMAAAPGHAIPYLCYTDERGSLFKSIMLYHEFGIAGVDGSFLPYVKNVDNEYFKVGGFRQLSALEVVQNSFAYDLLDQVNQIQNLLPDDQLIPVHYPLNPNIVTQHLKNQLKTLDKKDDKASKKLKQSLEFHLSLFEKTYKRFAKLQKLIIGCKNCEVEIIGSKTQMKFEAYFPFSAESTHSFFYKGAPQSNPETFGVDPETLAKIKWGAILNDVKTELEKENPLPNNEEYTRVRKAIVDRKGPLETLNLEEKATINDVTKKYKRISVSVHPDQAKTKESSALFRAITVAKDILVKKREE